MKELSLDLYKDLIKYAYWLCKNNEYKLDLVHDGYIRFLKYQKKEIKGEVLKYALMMHIKQAFLYSLKRHSRKNEISFAEFHESLGNTYFTLPDTNLVLSNLEDLSKPKKKIKIIQKLRKPYKDLINNDRRFFVKLKHLSL